MASGFWLANDILEARPETAVEKIVERCAWKFLLNREHLDPVARFGSEGVNIRRELESLFPASTLPSCLPHLNFLESQAAGQGDDASSHLWTSQQQRPAAGENGVIEIGETRRAQNQLEREKQHAMIKVKLIRSLKSQLTETK